MSNDNQKFTRQLEDYIDKGKEAYKKHNYDYAIELFSHALKERQDLPEILHYLHLSKIKKLRENPPSILSKGAGKVKAQTYLLNAKKLASDGKYDKAIAEYEKALSIDALNANIFIKLGNLYLEKGEEDKAISSYQEAIEVNNNNLEALKQLGKLYKDKEEFDKAEQFFSKAKKIAPNDADVQKGLKDLAALQTIDAGKWEEQDSYRTKIKDEEEAKKLEKESKAAKTEEDIDYLIEEAEKDLKKDPENTSILFKLADLYKENKDYNKAQIIYEKIIKIKPDSDIAKNNIETLETKKTDKRIKQLEERLEKEPDNDKIKKELEELKNKKESENFESLKKQVSNFPNDTGTRFKYGLKLKEKGNINEAVSQFQKSVKEPRYRLQSLNMLGLCFKEKNMLDLAVTQFEKALENNPELTDETKDIIYNLGATYEKMGKTEEATKQFKKIYEVDISYKDVSEKIEKSY